VSPIRPENRALYPSDWKRISARIRASSAGRCECEGECGLHQPLPVCECGDPQRNHQDASGKCLLRSHDAPCLAYRYSHHELRRCEERDGEKASWARGTVVLTVAHLNHEPSDCRDENLRAMCQRCHNRYDRPHRNANAAQTRRAKKGVVEMFEARR